MAAYVVFTREQTLDQSELEAYWARVEATLAGRPLKVLLPMGSMSPWKGPMSKGS